MAKAAAPDPRRVLAEVRARAAAGWPAGLTVLTGDDVYHLDQAQREILHSLAAVDVDGGAPTVVGHEKMDVAAVVATVRSVGMFAPHRVVLVRDVGALVGDEQPLVEYAAAPPPRSHLIVRAPALDGRRKLHKALSHSGRLLVFARPAKPTRADGEEIAALAAERGLRLDPDAARLLGELAAGDPYRAVSELDKLALWVEPGRAAVGAATLLEVAAGSGLLSGWEAASAVTRRDRDAALGAVRRLVRAGQEPLQILGGLAWRGRALLQIRALLDAGASAREAVAAARGWYVENELLDGCRRYTQRELLAFPATLLDADRMLKSRSIGGGAVLERLVERLTRGDG